MSNFTLTTSTDLGGSSKVSRIVGALWVSNAGPVVILLLLNDFRRVCGGERRTANDCLSVTSGVSQRGEAKEKGC